MFRKSDQGYHDDQFIVAVPMYTTTTNHVQHRAYGTTGYENQKHHQNLDFRASKKAGIITALRDVNTYVDVGTGSTYKLMDAASSERYLRTVGDPEDTLEGACKMVKQAFFHDPEESPQPPLKAH